MTAVVRGLMLRLAQQGQEAHNRRGLTDSLMLSISKPAKLLNHDGRTRGVQDMAGRTTHMRATAQ